MNAQPIEIRMAHLEGAYEQISERLGGIDGRLTAIDQRIDGGLTALDQKIDFRFDTLDRKLSGMLIAWLGSTVAIIGVIFAHH